MRVAIVGTYPPRHCGIGTFTADLTSAIRERPGALAPQVVAVDRGRGDPRRYPQEVVRRLAGTDPADYRRVGAELNGRVDVVVLQHEYGIFGGPSGRHVLELADALRVPLVTTTHTVRAQPTDLQRRVLSSLVAASQLVVPMTERSRELLVDLYGADAERVRVIPHGVPQARPMDGREAKRLLGLSAGPTILSFGLLGPGKRIENGIDAFARVADRFPEARYVIVGATHPEVRRRHGEEYRHALINRRDALGLTDRITFVDRFVDPDELALWHQACDVFLTAYANPEQSASGTLAMAVAAGRACISTPYEYALELLADGRGVLVPFEDPDALANALADILGDERKRRRIGERARSHATAMAWPVVADRYLSVLNEAAAARSPEGAAQTGPVGRSADQSLRPALDVPGVERRHFIRLRGGGGIWQHANGRFPNPAHGTCTDDVARALVVDLLHQAVEPTAMIATAIREDLRYLEQAFDPDHARFRNLRSADGRWLETVGSEDAHGRALQALGTLVDMSEDARLITRARALFQAALGAVRSFRYPRPRAYAALGCVAALRSGDDRRARAALSRLATELADAAPDDADWPWPEPIVAYDNGVLPQALLEAGGVMARDKWIEIGVRQLSWLVAAQTTPDRHLRPVGNRGWWRRGGRPAQFDQQPIEAASVLEAARSALAVTGDHTWADAMEIAYGWFLGANDLGQPVADPEDGACHDGLGPDRVSANCGAESALAWLRSVERMRELRSGQLAIGELVSARMAVASY